MVSCISCVKKQHQQNSVLQCRKFLNALSELFSEGSILFHLLKNTMQVLKEKCAYILMLGSMIIMTRSDAFFIKQRNFDKYIHSFLNIWKNIIFRVRKKKVQVQNPIHRNGSIAKNFCRPYSDFPTKDGFIPILCWEVFNGICKNRYF